MGGSLPNESTCRCRVNQLVKLRQFQRVSCAFVGDPSGVCACGYMMVECSIEF
jgi:hypothetical protein